MKILESGKYQMSKEEAAEHAAEVVLLRDSCGTLIDPVGALDIEEVILLKLARLVLEGDREGVERALAYFDDQIRSCENIH
jgi:hypothetical protein